MYRAKVKFADLQDKRHLYLPGDKYPREGLKVSEERYAELAGRNNASGFALIEKVNDPKFEAETAINEPEASEGENATPKVKNGRKRASTVKEKASKPRVKK